MTTANNTASIIRDDFCVNAVSRNQMSPQEAMVMTLGKGDSMKGLFGHGDPVQVDTSIKGFQGDGVYAFKVDGEGFVMSLQNLPGKGIEAIPKNPAYRKWLITDDMNFEVLGLVIKEWEGRAL